jgi:hypothetical protein
MFLRTAAIFGTLLVSIGITSCLLTMGAKERLVAKSASYDLDCETSLLRIKQIGKDAYSVMGCNKKASYVVECRGADDENCKAVLRSVTN